MPSLSSEGESATLAAWLVSVGDRVEKGDVIAELETDKATVELEAPVTGTIVEFLVEEGTEGVEPGAVLGSIDADRARSAVGPTPEPSPIAQTPAPPARDLRGSTPLARRAAVDRGVDLAAIEGSGPGGRVVQEDVLREAEDRSPAPDPVPASVCAPIVETVPDEEFETVRLSAMRKTIARRLTESKQQIPHFYLRTRCRMDDVIRVRAKLNQGLADDEGEMKISLNDFIVRAAALALRDVPEANVRFAGDAMHLLKRVDVSVAVATEGGLVTPVLRDADEKGLARIAQEVKVLALRAREGKLRPEQYQGGTFTISNLGMYGIETVYPILNPPQACILGVGAAEEQPVVREGEIVVGWIAALTLAADHRAVDGAVGARLLAAVRERLEDPMGMIL